MDTPIPTGFLGGAIAAGLKPSGKPDLGIILSETPCAAAGLFTRNLFSGANITVCREHLAAGRTRGIVIHAGQANACTGKAGVAAARATAGEAARLFGVPETSLLVGSTGVIGHLPKVDKIKSGLAAIAGLGLSPRGVLDVGRAMMTTDTKQKTSVASVRVRGGTARILGIAKGSGMIHPNLGTMLAYVMTDAPVGKADLKRSLAAASDRSFNCLTVDGDTSTSDMLVAFANGACGAERIAAGSRELKAFAKALEEVCADLARQVAADGEGATRLVLVAVEGAASEPDARLAAKAVASSNLVKCAIFGRDPNWGRIACAVGYSGARFNPEKVAIRLGPIAVFERGQPAPHDRAAAAAYLRAHDEIRIHVNLRAGRAAATAYTCDLTYDYVKVNAEYTT